MLYGLALHHDAMQYRGINSGRVWAVGRRKRRLRRQSALAMSWAMVFSAAACIQTTRHDTMMHAAT